MRYMLLIHSNEAEWDAISESDIEALMAEYGRFTADLKAAGAYVTGDQLRPTETATTVRVRDGETLTTDGPFAETKEQFGGYYLVEAADLDEAIAIAAEIPTAQYGSVEVRPVWEMEEPS